MTSRCYIVDIGGTIADCSHRLHFIKGGTKDWEAFFAACVDDKAIDHMRGVVWSLDGDAPIVYVTGRPERTREATTDWLYANEFPLAADELLLMREDGDHRPDDA